MLLALFMLFMFFTRIKKHLSERRLFAFYERKKHLSESRLIAFYAFLCV